MCVNALTTLEKFSAAILCKTRLPGKYALAKASKIINIFANGNGTYKTIDVTNCPTIAKVSCKALNGVTPIVETIYVTTAQKPTADRWYDIANAKIVVKP